VAHALQAREERESVSIARVRIVLCETDATTIPNSCDVERGLALIAREFPTVPVDVDWDGGGRDAAQSTIDVEDWEDERNRLQPFDARVEDLVRRGPTTLVLRGRASRTPPAALEMLTRWQRHVGRTNADSGTACFEVLLARLGALHDLSKPLVVADWNHAIDTWQWVLRLCPEASGAVQMAALVHDVERLESEADARVEHLAPDYVRFKESHARRGARIARALLSGCGIDGATCDRVAELVAAHERSRGDSDGALLNDADALSFFSLNSAGYLDYFGYQQTWRKVVYSLERMRETAAARLATIRLRADLASLLRRVRGEIGSVTA
jgi:Domain of unknown function (DUF4202)